MFDSLFNTLENSTLAVFLIVLITLVSGVVGTLIVSFKTRGSKGFFVTSCLMPAVVALIISITVVYLDDGASTTTARIVTIAVALGLIRFRSAQARAEEMLLLLIGVAAGFISGMGYVGFGVIGQLVLSLLYLLIVSLPIWDKKRFSNEKLLKITIPESLDYSGVFDETFSHYLKTYSLVEVKTIGMGSMFRLSYKVVLKNQKEEKEFIDELRIKNGNLEIAILPYVEPKEL